jgi:hypothetical protein
MVIVNDADLKLATQRKEAYLESQMSTVHAQFMHNLDFRQKKRLTPKR